MSTNPPTLAALGAYWTQRGGVNLGVVGNDKHCSGYHLGRDRIFGTCACRNSSGACVPGQGVNDYSIRHARDAAGLSDAASAIDLGRLNGSLADLYEFSAWLVKRCQERAPITDDVREVIYWNPTKARVERWSGVDRAIHWGPGNGDLSHRTHTHISFFRDSEGRAKVGLFAPFFLEIPDTSTEGAVQSFYVYERRAYVPVKAGTWLYDNSELATSAQNVKLADTRELVYVGTFSDDVRMVAYEAPTADANVSSKVMFVPKAGLGALRFVEDPSPDTTPFSQADVDRAVAAKVEEAALAAAKGARSVLA